MLDKVKAAAEVAIEKANEWSNGNRRGKKRVPSNPFLNRPRKQTFHHWSCAGSYGYGGYTEADMTTESKIALAFLLSLRLTSG